MSTKFSKRKRARLYVMQALYSWRITKNELADVKQHILNDKNQSKIDLIYFDKLFFEIPKQINLLNDLIQPLSNISLEKLNHIELIILYIAAFEFKNCIEVPYKVVINEALELCKEYGSADGHKYINGILDKMAKDLKLK